MLSTSTRATLKMDDTATASPGSMVSMFQTNSVAAKALLESAWYVRAGACLEPHLPAQYPPAFPLQDREDAPSAQREGLNMCAPALLEAVGSRAGLIAPEPAAAFLAADAGFSTTANILTAVGGNSSDIQDQPAWNAQQEEKIRQRIAKEKWDRERARVPVPERSVNMFEEE
jgi:hypothetical protein